MNEHILNNKPLVVYQSALQTASGYGRYSLEIAKSLLRYCKKKDYQLGIVLTPWGATGQRSIEDLSQDPETRELLSLIIRGNINKQPDVYFHVSIPNEWQPHGKYNIGISALTENSALSPQFIEGINRFNLGIVMSNFNKDVAIKTEYVKKNPNGTQEPLKVNTPIEVLPWGINTSIYKKTSDKVPSIEEELVKIPETFAFFYSGMWSGNGNSDRKDTGKLIETFLRVFAGVENPPCLILKVNGAQIGVVDRHDCVNKLTDITNMVKHNLPNAKLPNVYLMYGDLSDVEMNALVNSDKVKVCVSFSHGESWGQSGLTGTIAGKPTILPNWSGHLDYMNPEHSDFFEGTLQTVPSEVVNDWFVKESQWFVVDYNKAADKMKSYFFNYNQDMLDKAEKLRLENTVKFSADAMNEIFHSILDKHIPEIPRQSSIVLPKLKKITLPSLKKIE